MIAQGLESRNSTGPEEQNRMKSNVYGTFDTLSVVISAFFAPESMAHLPGNSERLFFKNTKIEKQKNLMVIHGS